jgi:hypothetical protein
MTRAETVDLILDLSSFIIILTFIWALALS